MLNLPKINNTDRIYDEMIYLQEANKLLNNDGIQMAQKRHYSITSPFHESQSTRVSEQRIDQDKYEVYFRSIQEQNRKRDQYQQEYILKTKDPHLLEEQRYYNRLKRSEVQSNNRQKKLYDDVFKPQQ